LGRNVENFIPEVIQQILEATVMERLGFGDEVTVANISDLLRSTTEAYNEEVKAVNDMVLEANGKIMDRTTLQPGDPSFLTEAEAEDQVWKIRVVFGWYFAS
jgi:hypothetical protein